MLFVWLFADRNPKNKKMRDSAVCNWRGGGFKSGLVF